MPSFFFNVSCFHMRDPNDFLTGSSKLIAYRTKTLDSNVRDPQKFVSLEQSDLQAKAMDSQVNEFFKLPAVVYFTLYFNDAHQ
jgi:hypothetical protein